MPALCPSPSSPNNGSVLFTGNSIGDNATFFCDVGFELIGDEVATCEETTDGNNASFNVPTCRRKCILLVLIVMNLPDSLLQQLCAQAQLTLAMET